MAKVRGASLGAAVRLLLGVVPDRTIGDQLKYVTDTKTGASKDSVSRQLGVTWGTINRWMRGRQKPSRKSQGKIKALFDRFWRVNHKVPAFQGTEMLRLSSPMDRSMTPSRGIRVSGKARDHLILEQGNIVRDWPRLAASTTRQINADDGKLFVELIVEIPYVELGPGPYTIEIL